MALLLNPVGNPDLALYQILEVDMKTTAPRTADMVIAVLVIVIPCLFAAAPASHAQQRGMGISDGPNRSGTQRRTALIIGNGAYQGSPLSNPVNDARAMREALVRLGFEVVYGENLTQNQMKEAIRSFGNKIRGSGVGLFYYAGHGTQVKGQNYLIPIGANVASEAEVEYESVDVGRVLALMEDAGNELNIIILDACRHNPFARSYRSVTHGLASIDAPSGSLIAYATAPGSVASDGKGKNGLYTQELLKYMNTPGLSIEEIFKRVRVSVRD